MIPSPRLTESEKPKIRKVFAMRHIFAQNCLVGKELYNYINCPDNLETVQTIMIMSMSRYPVFLLGCLFLLTSAKKSCHLDEAAQADSPLLLVPGFGSPLLDQRL